MQTSIIVLGYLGAILVAYLTFLGLGTLMSPEQALLLLGVVVLGASIAIGWWQYHATHGDESFWAATGWALLALCIIPMIVICLAHYSIVLWHVLA